MRAVSARMGQPFVDYLKQNGIHTDYLIKDDATATGDTYSGYFLAGLCSGCSVEDAMRLATKAAGIAVQRKGAAASIPEIKELK